MWLFSLVLRARNRPVRITGERWWPAVGQPKRALSVPLRKILLLKMRWQMKDTSNILIDLPRYVPQIIPHKALLLIGLQLRRATHIKLVNAVHIYCCKWWFIKKYLQPKYHLYWILFSLTFVSWYRWFAAFTRPFSFSLWFELFNSQLCVPDVSGFSS